MELPLEDVKQFFRLHHALMFFVNQQLKVIDEKVASPETYSRLPPETRLKVHEALLDHPELIDAFADENPFYFDASDLEIVRSWNQFVSGKFFVFRHLRNYTVFLSTEKPVVAYGVVALFNSFDELLGADLPRLIETTLLPFKGRIVYDGLFSGHNISFGGGVKRRLTEEYNEAKAREGVITSLPPTAAVKPRPAATKPAAKSPVPALAATRSAHDRIVALTDAFCKQRLDDEYAELCRKLAGALARKRPSPLTKGKPESWASGIVRVIGFVNFLGDASQPHHMRVADIDAGFGVSEATGGARSKAIRDLLKIHQFDHNWMLRGLMERSSMIWMIEVNGLITDARRLPRVIQEAAFFKGLIPYIPGDQAGDPAEE